MIADSAARNRALDTTASFIVQAPAGSGKTELLIQRYLSLLGTVDSPDAVVAITFTRKAAGEMRARVLEALQVAAAGVAPAAEHERLTFDIACRALERDRRRGWSLLQNPAQVRIETIDALCAAITRRMPWLARFGAMPEISEKVEDLYREAARNTLRHLEEGNDALGYLLLHLDNDFRAAERLLVEMLEKRDQWLRLTRAGTDFAAVRAQLESTLERLILDQLRNVRQAFKEDTAAEIRFLCRLERFPAPQLEDLPQWRSIAALLLTGAGEWRRRVNVSQGFPAGDPRKSRCEQLLEALRGEDVLLESLRRLRELPEPSFEESQWQALRAVVSVLTLAVGELQLVFRERGRVDFSELAIRASSALGQVDSPADLALALGHHIQHLLVDEFQDTSYTQFELLQKLTAGWEPGDGRTLFLVGDPMQSIYRFREADVSLFLKARLEGLGAIRLEPLTLSVNFRSGPELVEWANRTFEAILPAQDDAESGAVAYTPSVAGTAGQGASITTHAFVNTQAEAVRVVELIQAHRGGRTAVLVRSRSNLAEIVGALKRQGIRFQAIEIDQLGERPVVEDLMALTFALLHAADRVSWLAILRAPWCGLTLADLLALAGAATIWELLHLPALPLSEDGRTRIQRILPALEQAIDSRGRESLRDRVEAAWLRLGGPACVADETALDDASAYFDLLDQLQDGADLADFAWFRRQVNALFAQPDSQASGDLQLMTIHKAKGLEFDTVIVPGLDAPPRQDEPGLLLWLEQRGQLLLAPIPEAGGSEDAIYRYLALTERRKTEHEAARLLYVAATRARRHLHLLATVKIKDDGSLAAPDSRSFLKLLWPALSEEFCKVAADSRTDQPAPPRVIRRLPAKWQLPDPPESVTWTHRTTEAPAATRAAFEWVSDRARYTGTALHGFLQRMAREGLAQWDEPAIRSRRSAYRAVLANLGVSPHDLDEAAARVEAGLLRTVRDPKGQWVLGQHAEAACELSLAGLIEGRLYEAVIDRTFVDDNGVRWIIDYKTSQPEGADVENFLADEVELYRDQLERYARLMAQHDRRPIRLGLYFPLLGEWREWAAPGAMYQQASLFEP